MRAFPRRLTVRVVAVFIAAAAAAASCGSDDETPSPTTPTPTGTTPNGTVITADSVPSAIAIAGATVQVTVRLKNAAGLPVVNDTVRWNVASGGGTVANPTSLTDVNGIATIAWTLGKSVGPNLLGANITGAAVAISATAIVGPLAGLVKLSPDSQVVAPTGTVLLTVRSADKYGNVVPKIGVKWSTTGGSIAPDSTTTGTTGNGEITFTTPSGVGRYTVTATSAGLAPVTFIVKTQ